MDVVIIAQYLRNIEELKGNNSRFIYLANLLSKKENVTVEIITSNFLHGPYKHASKVEQPDNYKITAINEPGYQKNISFKRICSHAKLAKNIDNYLKTRTTPDCIYCAIPSLDVANVAAKYCKKNNVKFIIDIQDLWPEAFQMVFHIPVLSQVIFGPLKRIANKVYREADEIIGVSETYVNRAMSVNCKCKKGHDVFLGTDLKTFDQNVKINNVHKPQDEMWIGYCGTLGASYDLTCVIDALDIINKQGKKAPKFIVMGDGYRKNEFQKYAQVKKIDICFTGNLEYPQMCGYIKACDIVINPIMKGAAQSIINKHADYAASGLPVINTQECEEYRNLVLDYDMGLNCCNSNSDDIAKKIIKLIEDNEMRIKMGKNARKCAEEKFDRMYTYQEILDVIGINNI